jgi:hypothetical protein
VAKKKMGRPKLPTSALRSHSISFRVNDQIYRALESGAAAGNRTLSQEAEYRLAQSFLIEQLSDGALDLADASIFAGYTNLLKRAMEAAGENPDRWFLYAEHLPLAINIDDPDAIDSLNARVRKAVDEFLEEANAYLAKHGPPPTRAIISPAGTPPEVRDERSAREALHRAYARRRDEILKSRAAQNSRSSASRNE